MTELPCDSVTELPCDSVTELPCDSVTELPCVYIFFASVIKILGVVPEQSPCGVP